MAKGRCETCKRPVAGESEWRSFSGWEGYPQRNEDDYCLDPSMCEQEAKERAEYAKKVGQDAIRNVAERMEREYPLNKHAVEWAGWIREEFLDEAPKPPTFDDEDDSL